MSADAAGPYPPEEGHEPVPEPERRYPSTIGGAFYILILLTATAGIALVVFDDWRRGIRVVGGSLGLAALLRLVLSPRDAGMLRVRHRLIDVLLLAGVAATLFYLATSIPDQPPLR